LRDEIKHSSQPVGDQAKDRQNQRLRRLSLRRKHGSQKRDDPSPQHNYCQGEKIYSSAEKKLPPNNCPAPTGKRPLVMAV